MQVVKKEQWTQVMRDEVWRQAYTIHTGR